VRAALLAAGTLVAVPVALIYDLMLAAVAGAWLCRAGLKDGFLAGEAAVLAALFVVPLVARNIADAWHVPMASIACLGLLALAAWRARREIMARHDGRRFVEAPAELTS
jgi:cyanate permease